MAFLVKDLVDRQIFGGVRLVAGVLNVSNPILWVNVMEILDTPRSLNEGELVVSTGYGLEDQSLHKDLIHQLKKRGVSGLAIQPGAALVEENVSTGADSAFQYFVISASFS